MRPFGKPDLYIKAVLRCAGAETAILLSAQCLPGRAPATIDAPELALDVDQALMADELDSETLGEMAHHPADHLADRQRGTDLGIKVGGHRGPGIGKIDHARLIDVAPTVGAWLNLKFDKTDGSALSIPLKAAVEKK